VQLYQPDVLFAEIQTFYDEPAFRAAVVAEGPPWTQYNATFGAFELGNDFVTYAAALAQAPTAALANSGALTLPAWRFVADNWDVTLGAMVQAVSVYVQRSTATAATFMGIEAALLSIVVIVVAGLWLVVFWPSVLKVQHANTGVLSVVDAMPAAAVKVRVGESDSCACAVLRPLCLQGSTCYNRFFFWQNATSAMARCWPAKRRHCFTGTPSWSTSWTC
jgi:hypothetical protein